MSRSKIFSLAAHALLASWLIILLIKTKNYGIPMTEVEFSLPIFVIAPLALLVEFILKKK